MWEEETVRSVLLHLQFLHQQYQDRLLCCRKRCAFAPGFANYNICSKFCHELTVSVFYIVGYEMFLLFWIGDYCVWQENDVKIQKITDDTCSLRCCSLERLKFEVCFTALFLQFPLVGNMLLGNGVEICCMLLRIIPGFGFRLSTASNVVQLTIPTSSKGETIQLLLMFPIKPFPKGSLKLSNPQLMSRI